jgi:hypothetical protein
VQHDELATEEVGNMKIHITLRGPKSLFVQQVDDLRGAYDMQNVNVARAEKYGVLTCDVADDQDLDELRNKEFVEAVEPDGTKTI